MDGYLPDLSLLGTQGHVAPMPEGLPPAPTAMPTGGQPSPLAGWSPFTVGSGTTQTDPNKLYNYAILSAMLGSAGAGLGQAFRPWIRPPQPLPSPQAPQMPITAPASLQALTQLRAARKGF